MLGIRMLFFDPPPRLIFESFSLLNGALNILFRAAAVTDIESIWNSKSLVFKRYSDDCRDFHILILMVVVISFATSAIAQPSSQDSIFLSLASEKVNYIHGESVTLIVTLENGSPHNVTVNKRMAHPGPDLMIEIEDSMGSNLRWLPAAPPPAITRDDFIVLSPGQNLVMPISDLEIGLFDKFQREHKYRVKVRYQNTENGRKFNYAAWTGSLTSNTIMFEWKG